MKSLHLQFVINASNDKVWQALVDPKIIELWGAGPAKMDEQVGTQFKLWSGDIYGTNLDVVPQKKLVQNWFGGQWHKPSVLTLTLTEKGDATTVNLDQTDVPDDEADDIKRGWSNYYFGPMKELLEKYSPVKAR